MYIYIYIYIYSTNVETCRCLRERRVSVQHLSGVGGTVRAGSPAAVRQIKHSYANSISSSLGSVRVGERRAEILHLNQFPSIRAGPGWRICCRAAPVFRVALLFCPPQLSSLAPSGVFLSLHPMLGSKQALNSASRRK